nr:stannin isoform X2 [Pan troglodytes]
MPSSPGPRPTPRLRRADSSYLPSCRPLSSCRPLGRALSSLEPRFAPLWSGGDAGAAGQGGTGGCAERAWHRACHAARAQHSGAAGALSPLSPQHPAQVAQPAPARATLGFTCPRPLRHAGEEDSRVQPEFQPH